MHDIIAPKPLDEHAFDAYSVDITTEWETDEGCGFTGDVLIDGVAVFSFENDGEGGANKYLAQDVDSRQALTTFKVLSKENFPDKYEATDYALIYLEVRDIESSK